MKKGLSIGAIMAMFTLLLMGCGGQKQQTGNVEADSTDVEITERPTIYGIAANTSLKDTLELIIDDGDTLYIDITKAYKENKVLGIIQEGDRIIVVADASKKVADIVINQNMLLGDWVMPDPIDGSSDVGICIKEGGIAETIEMTSISYRTWKIVDGKLEIVSVIEGGGQEEEVNYYDITKLTYDSLVYQNDEDTYEYSRLKPKEQYGSDIKLEESALEDFILQ
jgi:hypothetical protein